MPIFYYEALDKNGKGLKGTIEAPSEEAIVERLRGMGYYPTKVNRSKQGVGQLNLEELPILRNIFGRITVKHLTQFTRQLATLVEAGLPIMRSFSILQEQVESPMLRRTIDDITKDIESGSSLSDALARHPKTFDNLYVNMVRAGEIGGVLEAVLDKVSEFLENAQALKGKIKSAMMYPVVVMFVAGAITLGILFFVIPQFVGIFDQLGADLPLPTMVLVKASEYLKTDWWVLFVIPIVIWLFFKTLNKYKTTRYYLDAAKLKMPIFGDLVLKVSISRFADTLSTLITSGVPILQSLDIVRETAGNEVISESLMKVHQSIKDGETIHEPMKASKVFPPIVYHMVAVGEETGAIDVMLLKVAEAYTREVNDTVNALTSILEPVMIVFLGALVGGIVIALYLPLFDMPNHIGK